MWLLILDSTEIKSDFTYETKKRMRMILMSDHGWGVWLGREIFLLLGTDTKLIKPGNDAYSKTDCVFEGNSKECLEY